VSTRRHLLVTNDFPPKVGGIQAYLWELWKRLDPATFTVLTARSHPDAATFDAEQAAQGIRIERIPEPILYFPTPRNLARIRQAAARHGAGLVVVDPALPLGLLGPRLGLPYAVVLHGAEVTVPGRLPVSRRALGRVVARADLVISAGHYPAEEARRAVGSGATMPTTAVIPPGVDCGRFVPLDDAARLAARSRLGIPGSGHLVVSVSRLVPRKGFDVLIDAARRLVPSYPDLTVAIGGTGRDEQRLRHQIETAGAPVHLLGRVDDEDLPALLGAADLFVMACRNRWLDLEQEGFGIVFLEAAAAGVPQIAGESGGAAEAVDDGMTGLVVADPADPTQVATAMRTLLADDAARRAMGAAARRRAVASFDYTHLAPRLAAALAGTSVQVEG
jgi:phosphatidylinositol alpha-1,6-mannosyltransferase